LNKKQVVIIGGNFAGLSAAGQFPKFKKGDSCQVEVTVVDQHSEFEWTPNIHEIVSGIKSKQNVYLSRSVILQRLGHRFLQDQVTDIDTEAQAVVLKQTGAKKYDTCLIACGHTANYLGLASEHSTALRTAENAQYINLRLGQFMQLNQLAKVVIVGGGYSGTEALGELLRQYRNNRRISFSVIEPSERLLNGLPEVVADDILARAKEQHVEFIFNAKIKRVEAGLIELDDGNCLEADLIIWTAGAVLPQWANKLKSVNSRPEGIVVNKYLQSRSHPSVFVAGDAARPIASLKKQAHHALEMGVLAGGNIRHWLTGQAMKSYRPVEKPVVLSFGDLNTYLIQGETVIASPALAAAKEIVFQIYMARLSAVLPVNDLSSGVANRFFGSVQKLLLPGVSSLKLLNLLSSSRVLQRGGFNDLEAMARAMLSVPEGYRN